MPGVAEMIDGKFHINKIRDVDVEDLLGRESIKLDHEGIADYLEGKVKLPEIKAGEKATTASKYETAVIPAGFTVSGAGAEKTVDGGLVIYLIDKNEDGTSWTEEEIKAIDWSNEETVADLRTKYDQFVWIPISHTKINDMFICQAKENPSDKCNITVKNGVATCTAHNSTKMAGRLYAKIQEINIKML